MIKRFSQTIAKTYYETVDLRPAINGHPCFTSKECAWIRSQGLPPSKIEELYNARLDDWQCWIMHKEQTNIEPKPEPVPESVKSARQSFFEYVNTTLRKARDAQQVQRQEGYV